MGDGWSWNHCSVVALLSHPLPPSLVMLLPTNTKVDNIVAGWDKKKRKMPLSTSFVTRSKEHR